MIDKIVVGNVPVHLFTINSLHDTVCEAIILKKRKLFLHANARLVELANTNETWLQDFCNNQVDYVMCDGAGIQLAARLTNQTVPKKIAYNIWIWIFAKFLKEQDFSLFLLGADDDTINNAKVQLENHVEGIKIVGTHHGFFDKKKGSEETENVLNLINSANPDILLVGFGMPVQELWISENYLNISAYCIFTCGGAFDFISGNKQVAPRLFIRLHMEWLFRFLLEPVRLFERVTLSFFRFGRLLAKQLLGRPKEEKGTHEKKRG